MELYELAHLPAKQQVFTIALQSTGYTKPCKTQRSRGQMVKYDFNEMVVYYPH